MYQFCLGLKWKLAKVAQVSRAKEIYCDLSNNSFMIVSWYFDLFCVLWPVFPFSNIANWKKCYHWIIPFLPFGICYTEMFLIIMQNIWQPTSSKSDVFFKFHKTNVWNFSLNLINFSLQIATLCTKYVNKRIYMYLLHWIHPPTVCWFWKQFDQNKAVSPRVVMYLVKAGFPSSASLS